MCGVAVFLAPIRPPVREHLFQVSRRLDVLNVIKPLTLSSLIKFSPKLLQDGFYDPLSSTEPSAVRRKLETLNNLEQL